MDVQPYKFELHEGLPPEGEPVPCFGFDADFNSFSLRWSEVDQCWCGVGLEPCEKWAGKPFRPLVFLCKGEMADFIKRWSFAPLPRV